MATSAVNQAIPAPANASFTNGEVGVGLASAPGGGTYHFSRNFYAPRSGLYLLKLWVNGTGVVKVGSNLADLQPLVTPLAQQVLQAQVQLRKGNNRIDIQTTALGQCVFAMLVYQPDSVLYRSTAQGWVYNVDSPVPDNEVPAAIEEQLPVFTVLPNWGDGISERISYVTDIPTSETGSEQARIVRYMPRRYFEASFLRKGAMRARLDHFATGIGTRMFWLPLWHEQYRLRSTLGASVVFPTGTLHLREFMVGDRVLVNNGDPDVYEVLRVGSLNYDTDTLTFASGPLQTWVAGSRIMPLRRARINDQVQFNAPTDRVARGRISFDLVDPEHRFGSTWGPSSPVWHFPINRADDITFQFERMSYALDTVTGIPEYVDPGGRAMITQRSNLILRGRRMAVDFRRFIDMSTGRAGRFYMPTRMQDIVPATPSIGGNSFDAVPTGFAEVIRTRQWARSIIAIVFRDGSPNIYRTVSDVSRVSGSERFTLVEPLPTTAVDYIERIQFMVPSRFDQDSFEFEHQVDESAAITTSVVTRSIDGDGMPAIDS